jgi:flagellar biosynthesis chaperone FliJ
LRILLSVRRRSVEQARYALGACLTAEAAVADKIKALDEAMARDREASRAWQDHRQLLEMAAIRLAAMQIERHGVLADLTVAEGCSARARGVVAAERGAAEAVEQLIQERQTAFQAEENRREQHVLDDIARFSVRQRRGSS